MKILLSILTAMLFVTVTQAQIVQQKQQRSFELEEQQQPMQLRMVEEGVNPLKIDGDGPRIMLMNNEGNDSQLRLLNNENRPTLFTEEQKDNFQNRRVEMRMKMDQKREEFKQQKQQLKTESKERIVGLINGITNKFTNSIEKLDNIEDRLTILIENDDINEVLRAATELKEIATDSINVVIESLEEEISDENGTSKEVIRELIKVAQTDVQNAWTAYREVIKEIKTSTEE